MLSKAPPGLAWLRGNHQYIGLFGLYLFALSGMFFKAGVYLGLILMALGFFVSGPERWPSPRSNPALALALTILVYVLVQMAFSLSAYPTRYWPQIVSNTWDLAATGGLLACLVAWWINANSARIARVLALALLGLLLAITAGAFWPSLATSLATSHRHLFGMGNGVGLYGATAIIGLLVLAPGYLADHAWWHSSKSRVLVILALCLVVAVLASVILLSQTRAIWLACLLVLPVVMVTMYRQAVSNPTQNTKLLNTVGGIGVAALLLLVFAVGYELVAGRMAAEAPSLLKVLSLDFSALPDSSVSYRVWLWEDALQRISERPVFGWGSASAGILLEQAALRGGYLHYHSLYLQLATELGIVGLILYLAWFALNVRCARRAWSTGQASREMYLFIGAMVTLYLITVLFQIRHDDERGLYFVVLFGALALTNSFSVKESP